MNKVQRKHWKLGAVGASVIAASALIGASTSSAFTGETESAQVGTTPTIAPTARPTQQATPAAPTRRGGRRGGGSEDHHLQGMNINPPVVELAPAQEDAETTQASELAPGAEFYDGQYYGDAVNAGRWGLLQVVAVIEEGELVDILIADYPRSTYESDIITRNALPTLISEAIAAQDFDVDIISRATDSSIAFVQSLESALLDAAIGIDL